MFYFIFLRILLCIKTNEIYYDAFSSSNYPNGSQQNPFSNIEQILLYLEQKNNQSYRTIMRNDISIDNNIIMKNIRSISFEFY